MVYMSVVVPAYLAFYSPIAAGMFVIYKHLALRPVFD
jgi:hypothetical protein